MNAMRLELEELGFAAILPDALPGAGRGGAQGARQPQARSCNKIETAIRSGWSRSGIRGRGLQPREAPLQHLPQDARQAPVLRRDVFDVFAFRIVVDRVDDLLPRARHDAQPVQAGAGPFKDYIAIPKANGYQSLHTVLFGPYGVPIEVQIRTEDMDRVAEAGIAAHWLYKSGEGDSNSAPRAPASGCGSCWRCSRRPGNSLEFLENVKVDLFPDEVYVFTPAGDIMDLPRGATAVDFAYAVHTDVGNTCVAAKIDRRLAPLRTPAAQRPDGGDHHRARRAAQPRLAQLRRHRQGAFQHPCLPQEPAPREAESLGKRLLDKALGPVSRCCRPIPATASSVSSAPAAAW
jgi:GTP diphosphokinase / guanosine-3',5'-bis(diphosphate) 3'-diphosphatase